MKLTVNSKHTEQMNIADQMTVNNSSFLDNNLGNSSAIDTTSLNALVLALEDLYIDEASCRRVVADAGLTGSIIDFSGSARERWYRILSEYRKKNMLDKLISIVRSKDEYGNNERLNVAWQEYLNSQQK